MHHKAKYGQVQGEEIKETNLALVGDKHRTETVKERPLKEQPQHNQNESDF